MLADELTQGVLGLERGGVVLQVDHPREVALYEETDATYRERLKSSTESGDDDTLSDRVSIQRTRGRR